MKKSLIEVYALAVCFAAMVCIVITAGMAGWSGLRMARPDFTISNYIYQQHETDAAFLKSQQKGERRPMMHDDSMGSDSATAADEAPAELSGEALTLARKASWGRALNAEWRDAAQSLVRQLIVLGISILVFGVHWFIGRRARSGAAAEAQVVEGTPRLREPPSPV